MNESQLALEANDEAAMVACGYRLGKALAPGTTIYLVGELGMGKTTLSRGVMQAFGHLPSRNEVTAIEPFEFKVINADQRKIHSLRMRPLEP